MRKRFERVLAFLMAMVMVISCFGSGTSLKAYAQETQTETQTETTTKYVLNKTGIVSAGERYVIYGVDNRGILYTTGTNTEGETSTNVTLTDDTIAWTGLARDQVVWEVEEVDGGGGIPKEYI